MSTDHSLEIRFGFGYMFVNWHKLNSMWYWPDLPDYYLQYFWYSHWQDLISDFLYHMKLASHDSEWGNHISNFIFFITCFRIFVPQKSEWANHGTSLIISHVASWIISQFYFSDLELAGCAIRKGARYWLYIKIKAQYHQFLGHFREKISNVLKLFSFHNIKLWNTELQMNVHEWTFHILGERNNRNPNERKKL